ncbi:hypothetical protein E5981_04785 [Bacteroides faecichinchillae]|nr:hypothetical protein E5981_04785 [Bacteroides faecichinchillae]
MTELTINLVRKSKLRLFMAIDFNNKTIQITYRFKIMQFLSVSTLPYTFHSPISTNWLFRM